MLTEMETNKKKLKRYQSLTKIDQSNTLVEIENHKYYDNLQTHTNNQKLDVANLLRIDNIQRGIQQKLFRTLSLIPGISVKEDSIDELNEKYKQEVSEFIDKFYDQQESICKCRNKLGDEMRA